MEIAAEAQDTKKREFIRAYEAEIQKKWEEERLFELDAPTDGSNPPKFLATFPYPYMNGRLHLGHAFTVSKADIAVGYQRLKGKRALFPFGFHCTGMPIKVSADKLQREMEEFGCPPKFPVTTIAPRSEEDVQATGGLKRGHSKALQKGLDQPKRMWQIMKDLGIPESEIPNFASGEYWVHYFPPFAKEDLTAVGAKIDWRRSFITTDVNPYYDGMTSVLHYESSGLTIAFVRWQFNVLKELGKIKFGKRETIFSPKDGQPCMDHDRASGEGVGTTEYTLVKLELQRPYPAALASLDNSSDKIYFVPATLRPETMYGQTNCWVQPEGEYGAFRITETEVFICTYRAARNLAFQGHSMKDGVVDQLVSVTGRDLIGAAVKAPNCAYEKIYILPMLSVNTKKTTGVVTSVPSDSPDDWAALRDLQQKPAFQEKYGVTPEMVAFEVVPIINIPEFGDKAALKVVEDLKIKSQNDRELLDKAKDMVYLKGFNEGVMLVGDFTGEAVKTAKPKIREQLINSNQALVYFEPENQVISRSGDECVVALVDQWYLDYGEEKWLEQTRKSLEGINTYAEETRRQFDFTLGWMHQWACSRTYGLGTRIPWDPQYLIESLSDSTIYMAYYAIAHLLQGGRVDGAVPGPANIQPEQLTDSVFEYIFRRGPAPETSIPLETLDQLRREFEYWYPVNLRVSGKDLIPNHLTFWLYNHTAIFPSEHWPTGVKANGFLNLNGSKMSKSVGNFITLRDAIGRYSADGTRMACAAAGDTLEDANFTTEAADGAILKIYTLIEWANNLMALPADKVRDEETTTFADRVLEAQIQTFISIADAEYEKMNYRNVVVAFHTFTSAKDSYVTSCECQDQLLNRRLLKRWLEAIVMAPIISYTSEYIWRTILGNSRSVFLASFPAQGTIDDSILKANDYVNRVVGMLRAKLGAHLAPPKKKDQKPNPPPVAARIYMSSSAPQWQLEVLGVLKGLYESAGNQFPSNNEIAAALRENEVVKSFLKKAMPYANAFKSSFEKEGGNSSSFNLSLPFDEKTVLDENIGLFRTHALNNIPKVSIFIAETESDIPENAGKPSGILPEPGKPIVFFDVDG